jgi:hypothetical protein
MHNLVVCHWSLYCFVLLQAILSCRDEREEYIFTTILRKLANDQPTMYQELLWNRTRVTLGGVGDTSGNRIAYQVLPL